MSEVLKELETKMTAALDAFRSDLSRLRTGRASLNVVDGVNVDYYGSSTPLSQVASLSIPDPTTIMIAPWEPKVLSDIEKALLKMNLGLTPNNDGKVIRLNIPPLTEERRKEIVKIANGDAENARNNVRRIRRDGNDRMKALEKDKEISEDQMHDGLSDIQDLTDAYIGKVNEVLKAKEEELLEV